ncbi:MAG: SUMF1/EgtB/PvdO family nonheme iron enzyme [Sandaracinaceae bacterium]|nr:SUMF1/EgtB/PvdO family nonheme iron enzyme [Sandaracinaceae bacterium]
MTRAARFLLWLSVVSVAALSTGCDVTPYCLNCADGGLGTMDGTDPRDLGPLNIVDGNGLDSCVRTGVEVCDGMDNDCDGQIDNGLLPMEGQVCGTNEGPCQQGTFECVSGHLVCGGGAISPMSESCNMIDDDCDGVIDDGDPGGGAPCGNDVGDCVHGITVCSEGHLDCTGGVPMVDELCDGRDNDCDGNIDNGNPGGGAACGEGIGECALGTERCIGGDFVCLGAGVPSPERCDEIDNNCNGDIDETFDLATDVRNCGECDNACAPAHAIGRCIASMCGIAACRGGYVDINNDPEDGCEYECDFRGAETCNGIDDDCDMEIDEELVPPALCSQVGECLGTVAECEGDDGWACHYGPTVTTNSAGEIIPESDCNDLDNDCDGLADDSFVMKGSDCTNGMGLCTVHGLQVCNETNDGLRCDAPAPLPGSPEVCNGVDDDCDGTLDEDVAEDWVTITGAFGTREIYAYEASRPDATAMQPGAMSHRPCSLPGRVPWTNVRYPEALAACTAIGARLCTETEWEAACTTNASTPCVYAYGSMCTNYQPTSCNGNDLDSDPSLPLDQDELRVTGAMSSCYANWGGTNRIYDLSGNVKEWTQARTSGVNPLRGGAYNNPGLALQCTYDFTVADDAFLFANVGFRCCR